VLQEMFAWLKKTVSDRKAEVFPFSRPEVSAVSFPNPAGGSEIVQFAHRKKRIVSVSTLDSFVRMLESQFRFRYGVQPWEGAADTEGEVVTPMPVSVCLSLDRVVAVLHPSEACLDQATKRIGDKSAEPDYVVWDLSPSTAWAKLLTYASGQRLAQAPFVQEWEDLWADASCDRSIAGMLQKIEVTARNEVTTGARRDMGVQEFSAGSKDLPEFVDLNVQRWTEFRDDSKCRVKCRLHIQRSSPPMLALLPVIDALESEELAALRRLESVMVERLEGLKIPTYLSSDAAGEANVSVNE